jgi:co-chaperonin GroES (HSP10)
VFKDGDEVLGIYNDNEARKDQQLYSVLSSDEIVAAG